MTRRQRGAARPAQEAQGAPLRWVIDASVGIKLFLREPHSERAEDLFELLAADPPAHFYVPDLFFVECANILWKYVRRFGYPAENAGQDVQDLQRLRLRSVSTAELVIDALRIGLEYNLSAYDASYVALAERLKAPLITADERLVQALRATRHDIRWLGEYAAPPVGGEAHDEQ